MKRLMSGVAVAVAVCGVWVKPVLAQDDVGAAAVRDALLAAAEFGDRSLIASVVENARLTPERSAVIEFAATGIRPDLSGQIHYAIEAAGHLGRAGRIGAPVAAAAARPPLPPGGNPDIPIAQVGEFDADYGLTLIGAQEALDRGYTGKGVVVAVIDTGIDIRPDGTHHPEFGDRIDPRSKSFLYWFDPSRLDEDPTEAELAAAFRQGPHDTLDRGKHGTHVSGTIAAGINGFGMQGVAPDANILALKAIPQSPDTVEIGGKEIRVAALEICGPGAVRDECDPRYAANSPDSAANLYVAKLDDVRVINGSYGPGADRDEKNWDFSNQANLERTAKNAAAVRKNLDAGQVVVMAAGNEGTYAPVYAENPSGIGLYPFIRPENENARNSSGARIYDDGGIGLDLSFTSDEALTRAENRDGKARGRIVVVVATDAYKQLSTYSSKCGVTMEWCISAPGGDQLAELRSSYNKPGDRGIYSTIPEGTTGPLQDYFPAEPGYAFFQGTSMAAPHVSGVVAVLIEAYPALTPSEIVNLMFAHRRRPRRPRGRRDLRPRPRPARPRASYGPLGLTGKGLYRVGGDDDRMWVADFTSEGSLRKTGDGTLTINGDATFEDGTVVTDGTLVVNGVLTTRRLRLNRRVEIEGIGGIRGDVVVAGTLSPGNSPGTLTVTGDLTLLDSANTLIEIDGPGTGNGAGNYDRVLVNGAGSVLRADGTLTPVLRGITPPARNTFVPSLGQEFAFAVVPDGRVTGSFDRLVQPSAGLPPRTRFDVLYYPNALTLAPTPAEYANLAVLGIAQTPNERALGAAIDTVRPEAGVRPDAGENARWNALYTAGERAFARDFATLTGQIHAEMGTTAVRAVGRFADTIGERQMALSSGRTDTKSTAYGDGLAWVSGSPVLTDVNGSDGAGGYDVRAANLAMGVDWALVNGVLGVAASYEYANIDGNGHGSGDVSTYQIGGYGTWDARVLAFALRGGLSYGDLSTSRTTRLGQYSARASADGDGYGGFVEATAFRAFETGPVTVTPSATFGYRGFQRDRMDETGSVFALDVPEETFSETQSTLAVALSRRFALGNGMALEPAASVGWRHDFGDLSNSARLGFLGAGYTVRASDIGADAFLGGIDLTIVSGERFTFGASYGAEIRENLTSHTFSAEASLRF